MNSATFLFEPTDTLNGKISSPYMKSYMNEVLNEYAEAEKEGNNRIIDNIYVGSKFVRQRDEPVGPRAETVRFTHKLTKCDPDEFTLRELVSYEKTNEIEILSNKYSVHPNYDKYESIVKRDAVNYLIESYKHTILTDLDYGPILTLDLHRRRPLQVIEGPEERARFLLKRMIGESAFRGYLKNGFLTYRAASGLTYQIFPGHRMVCVWDKGKPIEKLCLVFQDGDIPQTDAVIMRLLMLESNEEEFRRLANVFSQAVAA